MKTAVILSVVLFSVLRAQSLPATHRAESARTPRATVVGRVLDIRGIPIADARVQLAWPGRQPFVSPLLRELPKTRSDAKGRFSIPNVEQGSYIVGVLHPDFESYQSASFTVMTGEVNCPDIVLRVGGRIVGHVRLPDGRPDGRAAVCVATYDAKMVLVSEKTSYTDKHGRFEVSGLAVGEHRVVVVKRSGELLNLADLLQALTKPSTIRLAAGEAKEIEL